MVPGRCPKLYPMLCKKKEGRIQIFNQCRSEAILSFWRSIQTARNFLLSSWLEGICLKLYQILQQFSNLPTFSCMPALHSQGSCSLQLVEVVAPPWPTGQTRLSLFLPCHKLGPLPMDMSYPDFAGKLAKVIPHPEGKIEHGKIYWSSVGPKLGSDLVELFFEISVDWQFHKKSALPRPWRNDVKMVSNRYIEKCCCTILQVQESESSFLVLQTWIFSILC